MPTKKWTGFKVAVYVALTAYAYHLLKAVYITLTDPNKPGQRYYFDNTRFHITWISIFAFFFLFELTNAWLIRHHLEGVKYPSKKFIQFHDFLIIMNIALVGFKLYTDYENYLWFNKFSDSIRETYPNSFLFSTLIGVVVSLLNIYTIIGVVRFRKYLKQQANIREEAMLNAIGSPENSD